MSETTSSYLIGIDQSTQGTKALLFDETGVLTERCDLPHRQIINELGWVSHDPEEIYANTVAVVRKLLKKASVPPAQVKGIGISNQRETTCIWDRATGKPLVPAIVWQCARAAEICEREEIREKANFIFQKTGLKLSPYFPAAKLAWLLENTEGAKEMAVNHQICHGTMDSYLIFRMTGGLVYATDYSNASRTQLFNIFTLEWDSEICELFGVDRENLPQVQNSNEIFGETTLEGVFPAPVPIAAVMGDSHAALFGQQCQRKGMTKATYGTGSSIMMNIGDKPVLSKNGLVTSLAWGRDGKVDYVLEGNLNYTGAVITWLKDDLGLIDLPKDTGTLAAEAHKQDELYLVPAFSGLGAPYWNSNAKAAIVGMDRTTGRKELVRAGLECIAYQITDILKAMEEDSGVCLEELRVDGGPTGNGYLMQFQSDISGKRVLVSQAEELSGIGAAYMAGITLGLWDESVFVRVKRSMYEPQMGSEQQAKKYAGWKNAVSKVLI